jgi:hypothetical protein
MRFEHHAALRCFSSASTVKFKGGTLLSMRDLSIGDEILVSEDKCQAVCSFGHKRRKIWRLPTSRSLPLPLEITSDHLDFL